ncbi:ECF transporter S component [uncultured Thomasclavelia sp.]|uniref:ECF transporter S component n=1 Tax=uncultured Thomasclavelia sp. TaxID=3025759 RepID=UPI0025D074C7|nr:ECF transporter S component [uncultured Thomasclavelia sp.]
MKNRKIKNLVLYAMFIAIEMLLVFIPFLGYIPIGPLRATTLHIPVIIAGVTLGKKGGALIGLVFGLSSLFYNTINPTITSFVFSPFISGNLLSALIAIVPRVLIGYIAGIIFEQFQKGQLNDNIGIILAGIAGSLVNTILVLAGIYFIFGQSYATAINQDFNLLLTYLIGIISTNGIIEAIVGTIIAFIVCQPLLKYTKKGY